ncbi:MAG: MFS transporter, partial [Eggerthellaceae bacterium]|nr:MFS transporter [Eggerthellaceae bacterium]
REGAREAVSALPPFKPSLVLDPATRKFSFFMFLVALSYSSVNSFVDAYTARIGLEGWSAAVFLVYAVMLVLVRPPAGKLQDRLGENAVLYPSISCMALAALTCAACTYFPTPALLVVVGIFIALGFGTSMSAGIAVVGRMSGGTKAAPGIATFYLLCDFGCGIGPLLLGLVIGSFGYVGMYLTCSIIALIGVAYYHFSHGRHAAHP